MTREPHDLPSSEPSALVSVPVPPGEPVQGGGRSPNRVGLFVRAALVVILIVTIVNVLRFSVGPRTSGTIRPLPAVGVQQLVGPVPTRDPMTWMCLPGSLLWNAVVATDSSPGTHLTQAQGEGIRAALNELKGLSTSQNDAWAQLSYTVQSVLTRKQLQWLASNRSRLSGPTPSLDAEYEVVFKKAHGRRNDGQGGTPQSTDVMLNWTADELAAGLMLFEGTGDALTPDQAARLLGPIQAYRDNKKQIGEVVRKAVLVLEPHQLEAITARLAEARKKGTYDEQQGGVDGEASLAGLGSHAGSGQRSP